ncbi:tannase/feruloyl esterase family alpha/beta hydrolase [Amycolatopsis benzoatilytica]|uniref:tannase/feruloyl esterase family alpha/beta hydrolase n=1 Tax=Amycolatopsis benzoatilytica TaxID=346045 RepID=UPI0003A49653|nr:tannase/feruloyl esterase family alpha/beta hydrolase [Amycolatopsis benzoatilytica]
MKRWARIVPFAALVPLLVGTAGALSPTAAAAPAPTCAATAVTAPPGAQIETTHAERHPGGTVTFPATPFTPAQTVPDVPAYCQIEVTLTHPGANDHVKVAVTLPESHWSGRLQAAGGSAYNAGDFTAPLVQAVKDGYAGVTTDAGLPLTFIDTSWGLRADGTVNQPLLTNFASRSAHEEALLGKDIALRYYGKAVSYSYWNGCSTGGRQGYSEAQNYPGDFNGILADAPAVQWSQFAVATLWPQTVMNNEHDFPSNCVLARFQQAAIQACDAKDGVRDGIVDIPDECGYDPRSLIGTKVLCEGKEITVTAADARVVGKIWDGPADERGRKLWPGLPKGASFAGVAATRPAADGTLTSDGFVVATAWVKAFVKKDLGFDTANLSYRQYADVFRQSVREYDRTIGTSNADLSAFRRAGGKLISYVGTADQLIPPDGTLLYRERVQREMGGARRVNDFYRLFLAPGTPHCQSGPGAAYPVNPLGALVDWVEHGTAPATLPAKSDTGRTRDLCPYPQISRYSGHGDPAVAASYRCR